MDSKSDSVRTQFDGKFRSLRMRGGTGIDPASVEVEVELEVAEDRKRGEAGIIVVEKGVGADGGGR